jgi:hypothetical protein
MSAQRHAAQRTPIIAQRVRRIGGQSFAFVPHRFLRQGFFASLGAEELQLYLFLVLAGNRDGVSFYHYDTICSVLEVALETYIAARNALIARDLIAFDGSRFQVLSLPAKPVAVPARPLQTIRELADHDPATIRTLIRSSLARPTCRDDDESKNR